MQGSSSSRSLAVGSTWSRSPESTSVGPLMSRASGCDQLGDLAAHRVPNDQVPLDFHGADDALRIIGEIGNAVALRRCVRFAPAAVVEGNRSVPICELVDEFRPGARRAAPIVEHHQRGFAPTPIANIDVNVAGLDLHARCARRLFWIAYD